MMWIEHDNYFGPDRRRRRFSLRIHDRRRENCAGTPPPLSTALRQLRMRVLDAHGETADAFIERVHSTELLAHMQGESEAAVEISHLGIVLERWGRDYDMRPFLCERLDRAQAALRGHHELETQSG